MYIYTCTCIYTIHTYILGILSSLSLPPSLISFFFHSFPSSLSSLPPSLSFSLCCSEELERLYQLEMQRLEEDRLRALEEEKAMKQRTLESDVALQNLDKVRQDYRTDRVKENSEQ